MISRFVDVWARASCSVLAQLGVGDAISGIPFIPDLSQNDYEVLAIIGLAHDIKGSAVFNMSRNTAKAIASTMLCGMPTDGLDDLARSAICEFANMASGTAASALGPDINIDITPPALIMGQKMTVLVSPKEVMAVQVATPLGEIEICLGLTR